MKRKFTIILFAVAALVSGAKADARCPVIIHSHNDYVRTVPFYQAYSQKCSSIEVDLFYKNGKLLVGHDLEDLDDKMTFERLYVEPLVNLFDRNGGRAWEDSDAHLQLMIELKSKTEPALGAVVRILDKYPDVFDTSVNKDAVRITITGNVPEPGHFTRYPDYICFDGIVDADYTEEQLGRVALFSANFKAYSRWNGKGSIVPEEYDKLMAVVDKAHSAGKPIRFWGAPEGVTVYYTFYNMGIDYMNTDAPEACAAFYSDFSNKNFCFGKAASGNESGMTGTKKLDRATKDFGGFRNDRLQLSKGIEVYMPTYLNDGQDKPVKNVIFMIGDGMGLNQITAGAYANKGLTILNINHIGLQRNNALNAFTTDSAAGGSALATGERHNNRHISATPEGEPVFSLSDHFHAMDKAVGVLTLGNVADATPSAFYGHSVERDNSDEITRYLTDGRLDLLCGSGIRQFKEREDGLDIIAELSEEYDFVRDIRDINLKDGKVICIDERMDDAAEEDNLSLLADATREAIAKLYECGEEDGFFLMVEGAKIDYAGHSRCLPGSIIEMLSFDMAVAEALKFADKNGETLVVITADHETGGLTLLDGDEATGRLMAVYVTDDHTPAMLPVFAYGPGADKFIGSYLNTEIARRIKSIVK